MRPRLFCVLAVAIIGFSPQILSGMQSSVGASSESDLIQAFRQAHNRRDLEAMLNLFCWDGVTPEIRHVTETHIEESFDETIQSVRMTSEHPKGRMNQYIRDGRTYGFNLPLVKELVVETASPGAGSPLSYYPIGLKNGRYAIALMAPVSGSMSRSQITPTKKVTPSRPAVAGTSKLAIRSMTPLIVQLDQTVGQQLIDEGGAFTATFKEAVVVDGTTVIPEGATAAGKATSDGEHSPQMALNSIRLDGADYPVKTFPITFNQRVSFPPGTDMNFHLMFSIALPAR
jgi:hypothetical protein